MLFQLGLADALVDLVGSLHAVVQGGLFGAAGHPLAGVLLVVATRVLLGGGFFSAGGGHSRLFEK